jgi:menaquinol-cytochrome c reductase iron-sulfur subunit
MERRSFLKLATAGLGALFAAVLGLPALAFLLDPRNRPARSGDFKPVARLSELQVDVPKQVVIRDVRKDAWTLHHPNDVIGRVWLVRRKNDEVDAFTTICPHLGCSVNFEDKSQLFLCPCHGGTFDLSGGLVQRPGLNNPAPRGMDKLDCRRDPADPDRIEVKYQNFKQGEKEKILKA